jgi:hypothetical protein
MTETTAAVSGLAGAVDHVIKLHDEWVADETKTENIPPEPFITACEQLFEVARKCDVRGLDRRLLASVNNFELACRAWTSGMATRPNGEPPTQFWDTLRCVIHERRAASQMVIRRIESVATLRRQKVSDVQISRFIYGHKGVGPFLDSEGRILHDLIDKEEKQPGSVVPADWVHPAEVERFASNYMTIGAKEAPVEPEGKGRKEPATIEGLLRDGANIEQICAACNVSPKQVKAISQALDIPIKSEHTEAVAAN